MQLGPTHSDIMPNPQHKRDSATGSDKSFAPPAGKVWRVLWGYALFATSGTAGDREVVCEVTNAQGDLWRVRAVAVQKSNETAEYHFTSTVGEAVGAKAGEQYLPLPSLLLLKDEDAIRFYDTNDVDVSGDTLDSGIVILEYDE